MKVTKDKLQHYLAGLITALIVIIIMTVTNAKVELIYLLSFISGIAINFFKELLDNKRDEYYGEGFSGKDLLAGTLGSLTAIALYSLYLLLNLIKLEILS